MFSTLQEVELFFKQRQRLGMKPGLERIHGLLNKLGNPEEKMTAIHLAGTNGKGSTLHFIKAALMANHYQVGVFTSPSFHGLRGHILLDDKMIPESELISILNKVYPYVSEMDKVGNGPTEFEVLTAVAFSYFAENGEIILVETGMGGRFDTTNSFHPILSIITNIALDHTDYLGATREEIAYHKAGIIKQHSPVILGKIENGPLSVIVEEARNNQAPIYRLGEDFYFEKNGGKIIWKSGDGKHSVNLMMKGVHQYSNVSLALQTLKLLEELDYNLDWLQAIDAMEKTELPGRFECVHRKPTVVVDAAHNPDGIKAFLHTVQKHYPDAEKHVIVAMFQDKATEEMLHLLNGYFDYITLTSFDHPRAWNPFQIEVEHFSNVKKINTDYIDVFDHIVADENIYFITGSLHFITEARRYFLENV